MTDATKLAESLRAMRRNARNAYVSARPGASYSITMDAMRLGDLTDAADLIERQASELAEWRSVFGHIGATPDDCGNAIVEARKAAAVLLTDVAADSVVDGMGWDLDLTERADMRRLVRSAELAVLAANGKAVA